MIFQVKKIYFFSKDNLEIEGNKAEKVQDMIVDFIPLDLLSVIQNFILNYFVDNKITLIVVDKADFRG